jgi:hypothetical protein
MANLRWDGNDFRNEQDSSGATADLVSHSGKLQQGYQHGSLTQGLIAYYPMENSVNEIIRDGALKNDGKDNTSAGYVSGKVGSYAKEFDDNDDDINLGPNLMDLEDGDSVTIAAWARFTDFETSDNPIVSNWGGNTDQILFYENSNGAIQAFAKQSNSSSTSASFNHSLSTSTWYHLTAVFDSSGTIKIYKDGELKAENNSWDGTWTDSSDDWLIGNRNDRRPHGGAIDDVRIYDRPLSQPEIEALTNLSKPSGIQVTEKQVPGQDQGGISRYKLNGNVNDSWGNNDGTDKTSVSPSYTTGVYGQAKNFDGTDDYVRLESSSSSFDFLASSYNVSISFWFKFSSSSDFSTLVNGYEGSGRGWFTGEVSGNMRGRWREPSSGNTDQVETSKSYDDGNWHHYVCRRTGGTAEDIDIFIDGKNESLNTISNDDAGTWSPSGSVDIGARFDANNSNVNNYSGEIEDVRIYNTALTPQQVEKLYQKGAYRIPRESTLQ